MPDPVDTSYRALFGPRADPSEQKWRDPAALEREQALHVDPQNQLFNTAVWMLTSMLPAVAPGGRAQPSRQGMHRPLPDTKENKAFKAIVATKLASQGGMQPSRPTPTEVHLNSNGTVVPGFGPLETHIPYPHMDEPFSNDPSQTKFLTLPESDLQRQLHRAKYPRGDMEWFAKQYWDPSEPGDPEAIGRYIDRQSDKLNPAIKPFPHRALIPALEGHEVTKDFLWGPPPTFQGEYWGKIPPGAARNIGSPGPMPD